MGLVKCKVVDTADPLQIGRVRVRSELYHRNTPNDKLPWAIPLNQSRGVFALAVPPTEGGEVFADLSNPENPVYGGSVITPGRVPGVFKEHYPNRSGWWNSDMDYFYVDTEDESAEYKRGEFFLKIMPGGNVHMTAGSKELKLEGDKVKIVATNGDDGAVEITGKTSINNELTAKDKVKAEKTVDAKMAIKSDVSVAAGETATMTAAGTVSGTTVTAAGAMTTGGAPVLSTNGVSVAEGGDQPDSIDLDAGMPELKFPTDKLKVGDNKVVHSGSPVDEQPSHVHEVSVPAGGGTATTGVPQ